MGKLNHIAVEEALKDVIDPELGVNVVDLGLVYDIHIDENEVGDAVAGGQAASAANELEATTQSGPTTETTVVIDMTLTTPACPLTDMIEDQVADVIKPLGATQAKVHWVWSPPWGMDMISDEGRDQLRMVGFNF